MNTGGQAVLSTSFLNDSDSIHRKTRMAGDTSRKTENPKAALVRMFYGVSRLEPTAALMSVLRQSSTEAATGPLSPPGGRAGVRVAPMLRAAPHPALRATFSPCRGERFDRRCGRTLWPPSPWDGERAGVSG